MLADLAKYKFLFDTTDLGIIIQNDQGEIIEVNSAAENILGYSGIQLCSLKSDSDFWKTIKGNGSTLPRNEQPFMLALSTGKKVNNKIRGFFNPKLKENRWLKISSVPEFKKGEKKPFRVYSHICDITEEVENRNNLTHFKTAVDNSTNAVGMSTPDGEHYYQNTAFDRLFGEIGYDPPATLYVNEKIGRDVFQTIMRGDEWIGEIEMFGNNKEILIINLRAYSIKNVHGKIIGLVGVHSDITAQKKAEKDLQESESRLRIALDGAKADSWDMNLKTGALSYAAKWAEYLGYKPGEIPETQEAIANLIPPEDHEKNMEKLSLHLEGEVDIYETETRLRKKNGEYIWVLSRGQIVERNKDGKPIRVAGVNFDITDRIIALQVLQESEEKFKHLAEESPNMIFINQDGKIIYANKICEKVTGYSIEEFYDPGFNFLSLIDSKDHDQILENLEKHKQGKEVPPFECKIITKDGSKLDSIINAKNIQYQGIKSILGIITDITDLRKAEKAIHTSEKKFRHMIEHGGECITLIDAKGAVIYESPTVKYLTGYTSEERIGKNPLETVYEEDRPAVLKILSTLTKTPGESLNAQFRGIRKNGKLWWINGTATNLLHDPNVKAIVVNYRDITKQKEAEIALRERERQLSTLIGNLPGMAYRCANDRNWTMEYVSEGCYTLTGYTPDEFINNKNIAFNDIILEEYQEYIYNKWQDILSRNEPFQEEYKILIKNGEEKWVWEKGCGIYSDEGKVIALEGFITDITEIKQIEEALIKAKEKAEESDHLKTAFLANMSHEIRTPMNGILGFTDLLKEADLSVTHKDKYLNIIQKSGNRMLNIINDLIDISKIEAGQVEVDIHPCNINQVLENFYTFFKPETDAKGLNFNLKRALLDKESIIETDETKFGQVVSNLIKNALKFTAKGGIEFGYKYKKSNLEFFVKDTGTGIDSSSLKVIFDRFRQGSQQGNIAADGSGLGLSISKAFLELMGGKIWVESKKGKGSSFFFTLPYKPVNKVNPTMSPDLKQEIEIESFKILIVEDDEGSADYLTEILSKMKAKLVYASDGKEAVKQVISDPEINLVLMDIKLPVLNGLEATKQIKQIRPELPVIAQTAFASQQDKQIALEAGCNTYITKPIHKQLLIEMIKKFRKVN